jgi:1L-myo-inositol 1-phosphate cytidylyltransferase / CDP-L-myo-inositol myo-inositolphosphotransferase
VKSHPLAKNLRRKTAVLTTAFLQTNSGHNTVHENKMQHECVILADGAGALSELCGISALERLLRTLQRCGITRATILSSIPDEIAQMLARPSWPRAQLAVTVRARPAGIVTVQQIIDIWPDTVPLLLVIRSDIVFDPRLLRLLAARSVATALIDSGVPTHLESLVRAAPNTSRGKFCGAALLGLDWALKQTGSVEESLFKSVGDGTIATLDVADQPLYYPALLREIRPFWFPAPSGQEKKQAEYILLDSSQKGTLDIPALVHAPVENFIVGKLSQTNITPNHLTIFCNIVAWGATVLFATGNLGWGIAVALAVGVLDGLDGKLARVKLETSRAGKLEHFFDALFENSWWVALAFHLSVSGKLPGAFAYLGLLLGAELLNGLARASIVRYYGKSISELGRFDRLFRLVGGRRNIHVWILALGIVLGAPAGAFKLIAWWEALTAAFHLTRTAGALWALQNQRAPH